MNLCRRLQLLFALVLCGSPLAGCENPEFAPEPEPGQTGGTGGTSGGGAGGFVLPDGGAASMPGLIGSCAGEAYKAEIAPIDLMLLVDSSASMLQDEGQVFTKWENAVAALGAFIGDQRSAGLGMGLHFFPTVTEKTCNTDGDCVAGATSGGYCVPKSVCVGLNAPSPPAACNPTTPNSCLRGQQCVPSGACSVNNTPCANVGQACPQGGGTCQALPSKICNLTDVVECDPGNYQRPTVGIGVLPAAQAELSRAIMNKVPTGGTPMGPAVRGMIGHLRAHLAANPGRKAALAVVTDGLPSGCTMAQDNTINDLASNAFEAFTTSPEIPTYMIGVFNPKDVEFSQRELDRVALAGGSGRAIVLSTTDDLTRRLQEALNQIRVAALPCEYRIPSAGGRQIDLAKVNVRFSDNATQETVPYVELPTRCDATKGGWYFDVAPGAGQPTRILTCPATCRTFKANPAGKVDLIFGCATQVIN